MFQNSLFFWETELFYSELKSTVTIKLAYGALYDLLTFVVSLF